MVLAGPFVVADDFLVCIFPRRPGSGTHVASSTIVRPRGELARYMLAERGTCVPSG